MAERSLNKIMLIGRLGKDAETSYTPGGAACTKFSIATSRTWKDKQSDEWKSETNWSNVVLWQKESLAQYLVKGGQVYVEGRIQTRSYEDRDGKKLYVTEVIADEVILLGGKQGNSGVDDAYHNQTAQGSRPQSRGRGKEEISDDDIPF